MSKIQWVGQTVQLQAVALAGGPKVVRTLGAAVEVDDSSWRLTWSLLSMAGAGLAAYHGYKRNHEDTGAAVGWGLLGALFPIVTVPVALAQGYGKPARGASANPESFGEVGRFEHEGKVYEAGGAYYDRERGSLAGYVRDLGDGRYWLIKWDGGTIAPLRLVKKYRGGFGRGTMWAWSAVYDGRVFSGRNGGPEMVLRMRAGRSVK